MAISVVLAVEPVADELIAKITGAHRARCRSANGAGVDGVEPDMGPLITDVHRDKVSAYVDIAEADGATIVVDGRGFTVDGHEDGFFFGPTLIDGLPDHLPRLHRGDLRPGALGRPRATRTTRAST